jgi:hypothetical protein
VATSTGAPHVEQLAEPGDDRLLLRLDGVRGRPRADDEREHADRRGDRAQRQPLERLAQLLERVFGILGQGALPRSRHPYRAVGPPVASSTPPVFQTCSSSNADHLAEKCRSNQRSGISLQLRREVSRVDRLNGRPTTTDSCGRSLQSP